MKKFFLKILYHAFGKFLSFLSALWASGLVSLFFEEKTSKNLWGISGERAILSSASYDNMESILNLTTGFIVFLLVDHFVESKKHILLSKKLKETFAILCVAAKRYVTPFKPGIQ